ncbi:hypothetical protein AB1Y20_010310 [Prymnesium parvum]|uniref:RING-type domain-containing protein n=1 Tax=Prymnesium parvum TaxID=97485 RepID=A0AB34K3L5_PRYPA
MPQFAAISKIPTQAAHRLAPQKSRHIPPTFPPCVREGGGVMKFGRRLLSELHAEWVDHYLPYNTLKQSLKSIEPGSLTAFRAEGDFLASMLAHLHQINQFYLAKESELAESLKDLSATLGTPSAWLLQPLHCELEDDMPLASIVEQLKVGEHLGQEHKAALQTFIDVCQQVDLLRKFSVINSLAVTKISKKHDKHSSLALRETIVAYMAKQSFYTSTRLASTFTHAQCIASDVIAAVTTATPHSADYSCSICLEVLNMPVVLSCTHRFCYGCLSKASFYNHACPLCKKELDLDPSNYDIDPVLNRFVRSHFHPRSPFKTPPTGSPSNLPLPAEEKYEALNRKTSCKFGKSVDSALSDPPMPSPRGVAPPSHGSYAPRPAPPSSEAAGGTLPLDASFARSAEEQLRQAFLSSHAAAPPTHPPFFHGEQPRPAPACLAAEEATRKRACTECQKAKAACTAGEEPCARCKRLGKACWKSGRVKRQRRQLYAPPASSSAAPSPSVHAAPPPSAPPTFLQLHATYAAAPAASSCSSSLLHPNNHAPAASPSPSSSTSFPRAPAAYAPGVTPSPLLASASLQPAVTYAPAASTSPASSSSSFIHHSITHDPPPASFLRAPTHAPAPSAGMKRPATLDASTPLRHASAVGGSATPASFDSLLHDFDDIEAMLTALGD